MYLQAIDILGAANQLTNVLVAGLVVLVGFLVLRPMLKHRRDRARGRRRARGSGVDGARRRASSAMPGKHSRAGSGSDAVRRHLPTSRRPGLSLRLPQGARSGDGRGNDLRGVPEGAPGDRPLRGPGADDRVASPNSRNLIIDHYREQPPRTSTSSTSLTTAARGACRPPRLGRPHREPDRRAAGTAAGGDDPVLPAGHGAGGHRSGDGHQQRCREDPGASRGSASSGGCVMWYVLRHSRGGEYEVWDCPPFGPCASLPVPSTARRDAERAYRRLA